MDVALDGLACDAFGAAEEAVLVAALASTLGYDEARPAAALTVSWLQAGLDAFMDSC